MGEERMSTYARSYILARIPGFGAEPHLYVGCVREARRLSITCRGSGRASGHGGWPPQTESPVALNRIPQPLAYRDSENMSSIIFHEIS